MSASLHDHLVCDHRRSASELDGLPLEALHRFEHTEQELNLVQLDHVHSPTDIRT
jgi:hypothetical protein